MSKKRPLHPTGLRGTIAEQSHTEADNLIVLHPCLSPPHTALLARWLDAGRRMGLCDASAFFPDRRTRRRDYVLVWVRENPDPAYMIQSESRHWIVTDAVRQNELARLPSFAEALHFIRPVLPLDVAA
jgi:hypothetical protein